MMDWIIGLLFLFLPGLALTIPLKAQKWSELIALSALFSLVAVGSWVYLLSQFVRVDSGWMGVLLIASFGAIYLQKKSFQFPKNDNPKSGKYEIVEKMILIGALMVILILTLNISIQYQDTEFDALSYHLPFIQDFIDNGKESFFPAPENNYQYRANFYPKLFEAMAGGFGIVSPSLLPIIPWITYVLCIVLLAVLSKSIGLDSLWASAFFGLSTLVVWQAHTAYLDLFLTALTIGCAIILLRLRKSSNHAEWSTIGLLSGAMLATKGTAFILVIPLLLTLALFFSRDWWRHKVSWMIGFGIGGAYYLLLFIMRYWTHPVSAFALGAGNLTTGHKGLVDTFFSNSTLLVIGVMHILKTGLFSWIPVAGFFGGSFRPKEFLGSPIVAWIGGVLLVFVLFILVGSANARMDTFPRFLIPVYALICVIGAQIIEKIIQSLPRQRIRRLARGIIVVLIIIQLAGSTANMLHITSLKELNKQGSLPTTLSVIQSSIPDLEGNTVYYANTPNTIIHGFEKIRVLDYTSFRTTSSPACDFLRDKEATHLVIFNFKNPRSEFGLFNREIIEEAQRGECGKTLYQDQSWIAIYSLQDHVFIP
jgi:4-amino-4-deoxy-L-arabinose transferase-like glycosyltransferase